MNPKREMPSENVALNAIFWSVVENGGLLVVSLAALLILARLITPAEFGVFAVALATVEVAGITNMLFHDALIQRNDITESHFSAAMTIALIVSITAFAVLWPVFPLIAKDLGDPTFVYVGRSLAVVLLLGAPAAILNAQQTRAFGFRILALRTLSGRLAGSGLGIIAALAGYGVWSLVIQYLAMTLFGLLTLILFTERCPKPSLAIGPAKALLGYGSQVALSLLTNFVSKRVFMYSSGVILGVEVAGFINLAFRLVDTLWSVSAAAISQLLLPSFSRLRSDPTKLASAYERTLILASAIAFPVFAGLATLSSEVIVGLFGTRWIAAAAFVKVLGFLVYAQLPTLFGVALLRSVARLGPVLAINVGMLIYLSFALIFFPPQDGISAILLWSSNEIISCLLVVLITHHDASITLRQQLSTVIGPLIASIVMTFVLVGYQTILADKVLGFCGTLGAIVLGSATYAATIALLDERAVREFALVGSLLRNSFPRPTSGAPRP